MNTSRIENALKNLKEALENLKNTNLKHKNLNIYENKKIKIKSNIKETRILLKEILENKK